MINHGKLLNWEGLDLELSSLNHTKYSLKVLHMSTSLVGQVSCPNNLRFKGYIQKNTLPPALPFTMMSQLSKMMKQVKT